MRADRSFSGGAQRYLVAMPLSRMTEPVTPECRVPIARVEFTRVFELQINIIVEGEGILENATIVVVENCAAGDFLFENCAAGEKKHDFCT